MGYSFVQGLCVLLIRIAPPQAIQREVGDRGHLSLDGPSRSQLLGAEAEGKQGVRRYQECSRRLGRVDLSKLALTLTVGNDAFKHVRLRIEVLLAASKIG